MMMLRDKLDKDAEPLYMTLSSFVATLDKMNQKLVDWIIKEIG